jgi:hypothetical protein
MSIRTFIARLLDPDAYTDDKPTGVDAVQQAIAEATSLKDQSFEVMLGEPDIQEPNTDFVNDPKVIIPTYGAPYGNSPNLAFELPIEGRSSLLPELLDALGLTVDSIKGLEGETVPVTYNDGNPMVDWRKLLLDQPDGENWTEEEVEEVLEEAEDDASANDANTTDEQSA